MYYTTIEQSKRLVELGLNPKSADMFYLDNSKARVPILGEYKIFSISSIKHINSDELISIDMQIPCWSLGALLDVLPSASLDSSDNHHYRLYCMERFSEWYDSAIGACVDMIEKLHKQNLL